jgi:protein involved in sex pheromone biosynthesis
MKTKTIILLGAIVIILSTAFAFTSTTPKTVAQKESTKSSNNSDGFALKDADQWK